MKFQSKKFIPFALASLIVLIVIIFYEKKENPYDSNLDVTKEYTKLISIAKSENKNLLIEFGANWCFDCHALSDILSREPVKSFLKKNYLLLAVDVGKFDRNLDFSNRFGDPIQNGIPAIVIVSPDGTALVSTNNGEFSNARGLKDTTILEFLKKWRK